MINLMVSSSFFTSTSEIDERLYAIFQGKTADSQETQWLDFKEDPASTAQRTKKHQNNPNAKRIEMILDECICLVNGESHRDTYIIIGVADKIAGPQAFTGTSADPADIEQKIYNNTTPHLRVEAYEYIFHGQRLLIIRIPQGLDVYTRRNGAATQRYGTNCLPFDERARNQLRFSRRNPDFSAQPSSLEISDLSPEALSQAKKLLKDKYAAQGDSIVIPNDYSLLTHLDLIHQEEKNRVR